MISKSAYLTGDGQPELIIAEGGREFSCNNLNAYIYQWRENRFVEITHGNFGSEDDFMGRLLLGFMMRMIKTIALLSMSLIHS